MEVTVQKHNRILNIQFEYSPYEDAATEIKQFLDKNKTGHIRFTFRTEMAPVTQKFRKIVFTICQE